jgi:hypothetical protein
MGQRKLNQLEFRGANIFLPEKERKRAEIGAGATRENILKKLKFSE